MISKTKKIIIILCLVVLLLLGATYINTYYKDKSEPVITFSPLTTEYLKSDPILWPRYRSEKYGFEIAYPPDMHIEGDLDSPDTIRFTTGKPGRSVILWVATTKDSLGGLRTAVFYDRKSKELVEYESDLKDIEISRIKPNIFKEGGIRFNLNGGFIIANNINDFLLDIQIESPGDDNFNDNFINSIKFFKPTR